MDSNATKFDDKDKLIASLTMENDRLRRRCQELLEANNAELERRRRARATVTLIRDAVVALAKEGLDGY